MSGFYLLILILYYLDSCIILLLLPNLGESLHPDLICYFCFSPETFLHFGFLIA